MKRFAFSLGKLLELREYTRRQAEIELAARAGRCAALDRELFALAAERTRTAKARFSFGALWADCVAAEQYIARIDRSKERLLEELAIAEAAREKARLAYVEARKAEKVLAKLRERREKEYYLEQLREESATIDDISSGKYARRVSAPAELTIAENL
jgi:flagellar protein FliJ